MKSLNILCNNVWFQIALVFFLSTSAVFFIYRKKSILGQFLQWDKKSRKNVIYIGIIVYFLFFSLSSVFQHFALNTHAEDLGLFDQIIWNILHGNGAYTTLKHENFFREHFTPIFYLLAPLYLIFDSPVTLLTLQSLFLALPAIPIYYITKVKIKSELIAMIFSITYLFCHFIHCANLFDFHQEIFIPFFILSAFYFFLKQKYFLYFCLITLAMMCKEDISLYLIPFSIVIFFKEKKQGIAALTFLYALAWFLISTQIIIPSYSASSHYELLTARYAWLGTSLPEIVKNIFLNPFKVLSITFTPQKIATMIRMFLPLGFLNIANIWGIILVALPLEANFLSIWDAQYTIAAHYAVPIIPFVYMGAIYGAEKIFPWIKRTFTEKIWVSCAVFILLAGISSSFAFGSHTYNFRKCKITKHKILFFKLAKLIPSGNVPVSAQVDLLPHLAHRKNIYLFPEILDADYVIIDENGNKWPMQEDEFKKNLWDLINNHDFEQIAEQDGYRIFKRKG